jgi:hypothetical protein
LRQTFDALLDPDKTFIEVPHVTVVFEPNKVLARRIADQLRAVNAKPLRGGIKPVPEVVVQPDGRRVSQGLAGHQRLLDGLLSWRAPFPCCREWRSYMRSSCERSILRPRRSWSMIRKVGLISPRSIAPM